MQIQRKPFPRLAPFTVAACLVVAAACGVPAGEASHPASLDETTTLSGLITAQVRATDFTALARSLNPIVDTGGGGCTSTRATIDTVEYTDVAVAVAPTATGSDTRITMFAPVIRGQLQYRLLCVTFRSTFTVRADAYEVHGLVVPRIDAGRLAVAFQSATGTFLEQPALGPPHHHRIVGLADRPHPGLAFQLLPVGEQDRCREGVDEPRARQTVAVFSMLPPVSHHVSQGVARSRGRRDHLDVVAIGEHPAAAPARTAPERGVDVPRRRDQEPLHPTGKRGLVIGLDKQVNMRSLQADVYDPEPLA